jgi:hypothetical protein
MDKKKRGRGRSKQLARVVDTVPRGSGHQLVAGQGIINEVVVISHTCSDGNRKALTMSSTLMQIVNRVPEGKMTATLGTVRHHRYASYDARTW